MLPFLLALVAACDALRPREACAEPGDEDRDGASGCDDDECRFTSACGEDCGNGIDDDGDGRIDCDDLYCTFSGLCPEVCADLVDNDADLEVDEAPCAWPGCPVEDCGGGDGDGDGLRRCEDPDCRLGPAERGCANGLDDDCDGLTDCDDPDCPTLTWEDCSRTDPHDADCDGLDAAEDPDCDDWFHPAGEECRDGIDDDGDGLIDCEDGDCAGATFCDEVCDNHVDDDADGLSDCWDDDCWGPGCVGATAARVTGGRGAWSRDAEFWNGNYGAAGDSWLDLLLVEDVRGALRVADGYGGTATTCSWTVERAWARSRGEWWVTGIFPVVGSDGEDGVFARCELELSPACGPVAHRVLPRGAHVHRAGAGYLGGGGTRAAGTYASHFVYRGGTGAWYVPFGPLDSSSAVLHWEHLSGSSPSTGGRKVSTARFELGSGDWYYARPSP